MAKDTNLPPFVALMLRVFVQGDIYERSVAEALQLWDWWKGEKEGLGPEGVAALTGISVSKAKAVLIGMDKKSWVEKQSGRRDLREKTRYRLTVPRMEYKEAYKLLTVRLPEGRTLKGQLSLLETDASHQEDGRGGHMSSEKTNGSHQEDRRILRDQTLDPQTKREEDPLPLSDASLQDPKAILARLDPIRIADPIYGHAISRNAKNLAAAPVALAHYGAHLEASYTRYLKDSAAWLVEHRHPFPTFAGQPDGYLPPPKVKPAPAPPKTAVEPASLERNLADEFKQSLGGACA